MVIIYFSYNVSVEKEVLLVTLPRGLWFSHWEWKNRNFFTWKTGIFSHLWMFSWMVMCVGQFIWCFSWLSTSNYGCFMVFVSENLKNRNFLTFMSVFMVFVSENGKTGIFSHLCLFVVSENGHAWRECYEIVWLAWPENLIYIIARGNYWFTKGKLRNKHGYFVVWLT